MSERRLSTNQQIELLINEKADDEDDGEEYSMHDKAAKNRIRKTSLYGTGARAKIPKIVHKANFSQSPYRLPDAAEFPKRQECVVTSTVPPGAHQDQFRYVRFPTTKSMNDPDRIFLTTASMTEGVTSVQQPPWYYGHNNVTKPADGNMLMAAARYGFRGSKDIRQRHVNPVEPPCNTRTEYTPKFLDRDDVIDEWVPPIVAAKHNSINGLESPKLWPENTEFVTGYGLKKPPHSSQYNRETTVALPLADRPQTSPNLESLFSRSITNRNTLMDYSRMESNRTFQSLPVTSQQIFANTWSDKVATCANPSLRVTMNHETPPYCAHTLSDPSDVIKYSGSTAFVVHTQSTEELKFRLRMERTKSVIPYEIRWKQVELQFRGIRARLKKDQTMLFAISDIAMKLRREAVVSGTPTVLKRMDFISVASKNFFLDSFTQKQMSLVYSVFDPNKKNTMRFVELIASLSILDCPEVDCLDKLSSIWKINHDYGADVAPFDMTLAVLCSCCSSDRERSAVEASFKQYFKPMCYKMSITDRKSLLDLDIHDTSNPETIAALAALSGASSKRKDLTTQPQFNICDNYLNQQTFLAVLRKCPVLLSLVDNLLRDRLKHYYGKDTIPQPSTEMSMDER